MRIWLALVPEGVHDPRNNIVSRTKEGLLQKISERLASVAETEDWFYFGHRSITVNKMTVSATNSFDLLELVCRVGATIELGTVNKIYNVIKTEREDRPYGLSSNVYANLNLERDED